MPHPVNCILMDGGTAVDIDTAFNLSDEICVPEACYVDAVICVVTLPIDTSDTNPLAMAIGNGSGARGINFELPNGLAAYTAYEASVELGGSDTTTFITSGELITAGPASSFHQTDATNCYFTWVLRPVGKI